MIHGDVYSRGWPPAVLRLRPGPHQIRIRVRAKVRIRVRAKVRIRVRAKVRIRVGAKVRIRVGAKAGGLALVYWRL